MKKKLVKKIMYYGLVISMKAYLKRIDGTWMRSTANRIVLLSNKVQFLGTRIYGPIYKEIRNIFVGKGRYRRWKYDKIVSYAKKVI
jgi:large subunit ribosomal protein L14